MKQLDFFKDNGVNGQINISIAIKGKKIAVKKSNSNQETIQFVEQYKSKGVSVVENRTHFIIDFLSNRKGLISLGRPKLIEIDLDNDTETQIEDKLSTFYIDIFSKSGFNLK